MTCTADEKGPHVGRPADGLTGICDDGRMLRWLPVLACLIATSTAQTRIEGRTVDDLGRPLAGVEVREVGWVTGVRVGAVVACSDADGRFVCTVRTTGVRITPDSVLFLLLSHRGRVTTAVPTGTRIVGDNSARIDYGDVILRPGASIRGRVHDPDGRPISGAVVEAIEATEAAHLRYAGDWWPSRFDGVPCEIARSDPDGRFDLGAVLPVGTRLMVSAPGWEHVITPPIVAGEPVDVQLAPTGFARGVCVDARNEPRAGAELILRHEDGRTLVFTAAADGRFEIGLLSATRYTIEPSSVGSPYAARARSTWHGAPTDDLTIRELHAGPEAELLPVHVVDAATGELIPGARVRFEWDEGFAERLQSASRSPDDDFRFGRPASGGIPLIRAPHFMEDARGGLVARAPGYADGVIALAWRSAGIEPRVVLQRAARVEGRVVDDRRGEAVFDAEVTLVPEAVTDGEPLRDGKGTQPRVVSTRSREDGSFVLDGVCPGRHSVRVASHGIRSPEPIAIEVPAVGRLEPLRLEVPAGHRVSGRIRDVDPALGLRARVVQAPGPYVSVRHVGPVTWSGPWDAALDDEARFELDGLPAGRWRLRLLGRRTALGADPYVVTLTEFEVVDDDVTVDAVAPPMAPARLTGSVVVDGARPAVGRLVVTASGPRQWDRLEDRHPMQGPHAYVDRGSTYELALPPGRWRLTVRDVLTGAALCEPLAVDAASGETVRGDLHVHCGAVRLRFEPADDEGSFVGQALLIDGTRFKPDSNWLPTRPGEHLIYLPLRKHALRYWGVRDRNPLIDPIDGAGEPTSTQFATPRADEIVELTFRPK